MTAERAISVVMYVAGAVMLLRAGLAVMEAKHHAALAKIDREAADKMFATATEFIDKMFQRTREANDDQYARMRKVLGMAEEKPERKPS